MTGEDLSAAPDDPPDHATGDVDGATTADGDEAPLAAIVPKGRGDAVLAALRDSGAYDDGRRIREHDDGTLAIPVDRPLPADRRRSLGVIEVVRQRDPEPRPTGLDDLLAERGWDAEAIATAPASWAVVGSVVLVAVPHDCHDEATVGDALLDLHREADTVLAREGIDGQTREPSRRVIAGAGDTETVHTEHGVRYALDLAEVMFSPGNEAERARIGALVAAGREADVDAPVATLADAGLEVPADVQPVPDSVPALDPIATDPDAETLADLGTEPEHVFDMFAGAGYFALPAAIAGARVSATEIDSGTFGYLVENAQLNGVGDRVAAYLADCREVAPEVEADRVVMGHYGAVDFLDAAFAAVVDGGVIHYHEVAHEADLPDRPRERLERAAADAGRPVAIADRRRVKSYGEGVWHVVLDAVVDGSTDVAVSTAGDRND